MNSLERVVAAMQHKDLDRVPAYPLINSISRLYTGADYATWSRDVDVCAESILKATDDIGVDVICSIQDLSVEAADWGQKVDYSVNEAAHPDIHNRLIRDIEDYAKIAPINPRTSDRMGKHIQLCDKLVKAKGKVMPVVAFVFAPLGVLSMMRGQAEMFMDCYDDPDAMHPALDAITETLVEYVRALAETGVHAVMFDTLFASQSIMSKDMWEELEGPYIKRLSDATRDAGAMVMLHNCGKGIYFDAQIGYMNPSAISFLYPPDDCESFAETKAKYGDKTLLIGAITPSWLMSASREEVLEEGRAEIEAMADGGGFVLATGCEYPSNGSIENAKAIVEAAHRYGKYKPGAVLDREAVLA
ncbi:MAG: uroporphyrinogen decarboxylase family protein [Planctomycetes bacterium]|nr:uroporphyrinogen decarboxylase family protein [Planctomycetota bacterium]